MTELKCKNCGAPLIKLNFGQYKCEYCGTIYETDISVKGLIEIVPAPVNTLQAKVAIPFQSRNYMSSEDISKFAINDLKRKLADALDDYLKITVCENPKDMYTIISGEIRVCKPGYKF